MYRRWGKRAGDIAGSAILLFLLSPLLAATAILVRVWLGAPVLFRQPRPGLAGRPFTLLKFRTMTDAHDLDGRRSPDEQRLTSFGRWLRSTSLDELPELVNVLKGEMSLVGPRPLLTQYLDRYSPQQARRHEVRPGITGLAQVDGRNALSWDERFQRDIFYVDHLSLVLDLTILARTLSMVLAREGVSATGCATMTEFQGQAPPSDPMAGAASPQYREERAFMTTQRTFLSRFEEILEVAPDTLRGDEVLEGVEGWDSLAVVSLIAMVDEQFGIALSPKAIAKARSVADLMALLGDATTA